MTNKKKGLEATPQTSNAIAFASLLNAHQMFSLSTTNNGNIPYFLYHFPLCHQRNNLPKQKPWCISHYHYSTAEVFFVYPCPHHVRFAFTPHHKLAHLFLCFRLPYSSKFAGQTENKARWGKSKRSSVIGVFVLVGRASTGRRRLNKVWNIMGHFLEEK